MRELKFRLWNTVRKDMNYEGGMAMLGNKLIQDEHNKLMQFTGLKDKNGKEIYGGDIIVCRDGTFEIQYEERFAKFIMVNDDDRILTADNIFRGQDADTCMRSIEVIGNIYENPELIKENDANVLSGETEEIE